MDTGFVFPGQGSQHVGMGAAARGEWPEIDAVFTQIESLTGLDLVGVMTEGPAETLRDTMNAQLAVFGLSTALQTLLRRHGHQPSVVAGHSLGEFSALVCGGWLDIEPAVLAVARRSEAMAECCASSPGAMSALLGVDRDLVAGLLADLGGTVSVANDNAPGQLVVSGPCEDVAEVERAVAAARIGSVIALPVGGAFHSPQMLPAQHRLAPVIEELPLHIGHTPLISSVTGDAVTDVEAYRAELLGQITGPVRWTEVTRRLLAETDDLVEVGPGTVLRGLVRKVDRKRVTRPCRDAADLYDLGLEPAAQADRVA